MSTQSPTTMHPTSPDQGIPLAALHDLALHEIMHLVAADSYAPFLQRLLSALGASVLYPP